MPSSNRNHVTLDQASRSLPAFIAGGLIGGLLLGVMFGNIPFGVAGGVLLAPALWFAFAGPRKRGAQAIEAPGDDA